MSVKILTQLDKEQILFTRKPCDASDVCTSFDMNSIPLSLATEIRTLPIYDADDTSTEFNFFTDIYDGWDWCVEVVIWEGQHYLIDNQGFSYCRYVTRIDNY